MNGPKNQNGPGATGPKQDGLRPRRNIDGWRFGSGLLPFPKDEAHLLRIAFDIIGNRDRKVVSITHHNADLDAVASSLILKWSFPWVRIGAFKSISQAGKGLLEGLGETMEIDPDLSDAELVIVLDSSSPVQVSSGDVGSWPPYHVIDHHQENENWPLRPYVDVDRSACSEIVLQMAMATGMSLTKNMAIAGMAGIIADTGKFRFAEAGDMGIMEFLLEGSEVTVEDVLSIIEGEEYFDISKKIAVLKSLRRVRYQRVGDHIVATSTVGSFESAAARGLLVVGCDVVFIGCQKGSDIRVSARAKPHIVRGGINLGKFMEGIGRTMGAEGGGHDAAAGLNGRGNVEKALALCSDEMVRMISAMNGTGASTHEDPASSEG